MSMHSSLVLVRLAWAGSFGSHLPLLPPVANKIKIKTKVQNSVCRMRQTAKDTYVGRRRVTAACTTLNEMLFVSVVYRWSWSSRRKKKSKGADRNATQLRRGGELADR